MSTAIPQVPPRPTRSQDQTAGAGSHLVPKIPPRPANRRLDRSVSPHRESYARSPLNEAPTPTNHGRSSLYNSEGADASDSDVPPRPSSVALPSIGQEGSEYAEVCSPPEEQGTSPTQTRGIAEDLKLHAPKPSLPSSSAKERVSAVTRTDSGQAAAFGIGKAHSDDKEPASRPLKSKASFTSQHSTSNGTERPPSSLEGEQGIPEIGQRVPMYPNAGDVQAPSPSPFAQPFEKGIGFYNDGSKPKHHARRLSARGHDIPTDAYGRYGHGATPHDRFEKAYYEKHPELSKKERGQYGQGRPEWAMSSEDLNKIVHETASRGAGIGTSPNVVGTPSEQIGCQASEEYVSRMSSPRPQASGYHLAHSNASETQVESPLAKDPLSAEVPKSEFEGTLARSLEAPSETSLVESEVDMDDVIHVDAPGSRNSRIHSAAESTEDLGRHSEDGETQDEYGAPILAADEVAKEPFRWESKPAVSPITERRSSSEFYNFKSGSTSSLNSRPSSRPASIHGTVPGLRLPDATHLEDLDEYEPLFPEEKKATGVDKPVTATEKLKRPELKNRRFPSQDVWEDTPSSLQYTATVSTPQLPEDKDEDVKDGTPEKDLAHPLEALPERASKSDSFLTQEKHPWDQKPQPAPISRSGTKQRFPSRDIWEDTPDSLQLQTTVATPQSDEKDVTSPLDERPATVAAVAKPHIPARPVKSKLSQSPEKAQPVVPERPTKIRQLVPPNDSASPPIPTKAKPQVPSRPSKPLSRDSSENVPLSKVKSNSSAKSIGSEQSAAAASKPKPPVPSRPLGSKIAALQGGFMSDLNKRLQLGPHAPKREEPAPEEIEEVKEKAPLSDARKGRARGPARRAPAKSPAPVAATTMEPAPEKSSAPSLSIISSTLWEIDPEEDELQVVSQQPKPIATEKAAEPGKPTLAPSIVTEQSSHEASEAPPAAEKATSPLEDTHTEQVEEKQKVDVVAPEIELDGHEVETAKPLDDEAPVMVDSSMLAPESPDEEDLAASTATLKPRGKEMEGEKETETETETEKEMGSETQNIEN